LKDKSEKNIEYSIKWKRGIILFKEHDAINQNLGICRIVYCSRFENSYSILMMIGIERKISILADDTEE